MSVDLVPEWKIGDLLLTSYPYGVDADSTVDIGEPAMVTESVQSMLADGDLERVVRYGNRTYSLSVYVMGPTLGDLAESEAALRRELSRPGLLLTHDPGDDFSPASVYEVQTSQLTPQRNDTHESHLIRKFTLTFVCLPFARSAEMVTVEAMVAGSTSVTIDTCDSATGWTGTRAGVATTPTAAWTAGSVGLIELDSAVTSPETWTMTRTGSIDFTTTPLLVAEIKTISKRAGLRVTVTADGVVLPVLESRLMTDGLGTYRVTLDASAVGSVSSLTFSHTSLAGETWQGLFVRDLKRTNIAPNITARQMTRVIVPGGTERTPASIHVESTTGVDGMAGLAIVHTCPEDGSGYSPPLRRWRTSASTGPETTDATTTLSGKHEPIAFEADGFYAEVPTSALPEGGYVLMARLRSAAGDPNAATIFWSTSTIFPDTTTQQGFTNGHVKVTLPGTTWTLVPIAALSLPSVRTKAGKVQIVLQAITSSGPQVELDEAWLFRADDDCALTIVNTWQPHLWLDSPDVTSPVPQVWIGDGRETQVHPGDALVAMGNHVLHPQGTAIFTAGMSDLPATSATFYPRWPNNAAWLNSEE